MKKILTLVVLSLLVLNACDTEKVYNREVKTADGMQYLVGRINEDAFGDEPYNEWYPGTYDAYTVNDTLVEKYRKKLRVYRVKVFMGTWCSDSQEQVPAFLKILDEMKFPKSRLSMYAVNEDKQSFYEEQFEYKISYVPTFIFLKEGKEVGRIVESPINSLEQDIVDIINGTPQKPNYSED